MRIGVIDKCALVTEEVWRRKNAYEAQPNNSRKLVATADLQPVRRRGEPLKRTREGFEDADPGRKGMVYSWVEGDGAYTGDGSGNGSPEPKAEERFPRRPKPLPLNIGKMDPAYTVRGHLHWVGVMWDWGWEGKRDPPSCLCRDLGVLTFTRSPPWLRHPDSIPEAVCFALLGIFGFVY